LPHIALVDGFGCSSSTTTSTPKDLLDASDLGDDPARPTRPDPLFDEGLCAQGEDGHHDQGGLPVAIQVHDSI
jgi:hypothetical protein